MAKKKTTKKLDPRLQRTLDLVDESWAGEDRDFTGLARELLNTLLDIIPSPEGLKMAIVAMVDNQRGGEPDTEHALESIAKIADTEHNQHCACCRARAAKESV